MDPIKIFLVDDHTLFRRGIAELINSFNGYTVCGEADGGMEFIRLFHETERPDIVLLDIHMPGMDGFETAAWLRKNFPEVKVLALSMNDSESVVIRMLRAGASGYLLKDAEPAELLAALTAVVEHGVYYSGLVTKVLLNNLNNPDGSSRGVKLNDRERRFLELACTELTYKEIADQMCLSPRTIDGYREALFEKLGARSRVGLVLFAIREGIIRAS